MGEGRHLYGEGHRGKQGLQAEVRVAERLLQILRQQGRDDRSRYFHSHQGFILLGEHYDVHRYHPPLVYGRRGNAETGEGISLAVGKSKKGEKTYLLITYVLPIISARAVPQQINFYNDFSTPAVIQSASWSSSTDVIASFNTCGKWIRSCG